MAVDFVDNIIMAGHRYESLLRKMQWNYRLTVRICYSAQVDLLVVKCGGSARDHQPFL